MIYEHLSGEVNNTTFDRNKFKPIQNNYYPSSKPLFGTGLWASPSGDKNNWRNFLRQNQEWESYSSYFSFEISQAARLVIISTFEDVSRLTLVQSYNKPIGIDWEETVDKIDAIYIEEHVLRDDLFSGWDVPSLVVLNPDIVE